MSDESEKWIKAGQFISNTERDFLSGAEVDHESSVRYRIRHKVIGALNDLFTVSTKLPNNDVKQLFEGAGQALKLDHNNGGEIPIPGHEGQLSAIIALGCRGYKLNGKSVDQFMSNVIELGIQKGVADSENISPNNVVVDIELNNLAVYNDLDDMPPIEKIDKGAPLTVTEYQQLGERLKEKLNCESIDIDEVRELARKHLIGNTE